MPFCASHRKVAHFASLNFTQEEFEKLDKIVRQYLRTSRPKFLRAIALQFSEQYYAGEIPDWPPRFVVRPDFSAKKKKAGPARNRPKKIRKKTV